MSDEQDKYQDFKNMLDRLLKEAEDPKNWADVAKKYNEYVAKLNDEINAVTSGVAASDTTTLSFSKIALAAVGTAAMYCFEEDIFLTSLAIYYPCRIWFALVQSRRS